MHIVEFTVHVFQAWKVLESCLGHGKLWKIMWTVMETSSRSVCLCTFALYKQLYIQHDIVQ